MEVHKINSFEVFGDNNGGLIYGVEWDIGNQEFHNLWFKTRKERDKCFNEIQTD